MGLKYSVFTNIMDRSLILTGYSFSEDIWTSFMAMRRSR